MHCTCTIAQGGNKKMNEKKCKTSVSKKTRANIYEIGEKSDNIEIEIIHFE